MLLVNILLVAVALIALVIQLFTPVIINIPAMAVCLIALIAAIWHFKRRRREAKLPIFAGLVLVLQAGFFMLSIGIFTVVTLPNENPEDSSSVVHGIRQILIANGIIEKPKVLPKPPEPSAATIPAVSAETVNAPEEGAVKISVDGDNEAKPAESGEKAP
ncbi:hypothetical protein [Turneriella parva]|uniref:Uncharacterized protein n=1 Tax=Turneriella parva (strain ATCC BAA-1111 / DSM 21527 / NCTC 11395 / H) TaxID=869212 RepID=I4B800_TURPD|nr:hypothetical protein [Turneriella parva]AFM13407.1 hypothetical protein Turpa_2768 [Turneriella parva DSM 21527]